MGGERFKIHRQQVFWIVILNRIQGSQFSCKSFSIFIGNSIGNLVIFFTITVNCQKVYLSLIKLANMHFIATTQQFKEDNVFEDVPSVGFSRAKQIISKSDVGKVVFCTCRKVLLALDII